jgi:DNA-binding PadR family transcriptional regulator
MGRRQQVEEFLSLPASVMHIAVALADGEKHGHAILRDVAELSGGAVRMGSGTLYGQ